MRAHQLTDLVLSALDMAFIARRAQHVIHHSDQGTQYTSVAFGARCEAVGVKPLMGSVGDYHDNAMNAMCESFFATLECELLDRPSFRTKAEAEAAVFQSLEGRYNPHRLHSSLGYVSSINYERAYHQNPANPFDSSSGQPSTKPGQLQTFPYRLIRRAQVARCLINGTPASSLSPRLRTATATAENFLGAASAQARGK